MKTKNVCIALIPIMLSFFAMGFVDLVGIATSYVKADFELSHTVSSLLPVMVFFWFLIFSVPTSMLMNKIGRRKTVLVSLIITALSLLLPIISYSYPIMLISFSLLGIGNAIMQVSLNPLLSNIVSGNKLASSLTFGQFVKAIASFSAPLIARWGAMQFENWRILFPVFMILAVSAVLVLGFSNIEESDEKGDGLNFIQCLGLLGNKVILLSFLGIMCHVGIDVGVNVTAPKILMERIPEMMLENAGIATSVYFFFRLSGCLVGTFVLSHFSSKKFFVISVIMMVLSIIGLFVFSNIIALYIAIALVGFGNSNIFPIILSQALLYMPDKKNEISGLMIMGLIGGAIFPFIMGILTDIMDSQAGALIILAVGIIYLMLLSSKLKDNRAA